MRSIKLRIATLAASLGFAAAIVSLDAAAIDEVIVYGTSASAASIASPAELQREMTAYIETMRKPYRERLEEELSVAEEVLYRRGNFNGTFDQVICDALTTVNDAQISLSPGFRWGRAPRRWRGSARGRGARRSPSWWSSRYTTR